jgi:hypothetical protein
MMGLSARILHSYKELGWLEDKEVISYESTIQILIHFLGKPLRCV